MPMLLHDSPPTLSYGLGRFIAGMFYGLFIGASIASLVWWLA